MGVDVKIFFRALNACLHSLLNINGLSFTNNLHKESWKVSATISARFQDLAEILDKSPVESYMA
jgi:hypothetical protein